MHDMVVPYSSNVRENSLVQWNVWIHRLPRKNVSTLSPVLVGRNFSSVHILLIFTPLVGSGTPAFTLGSRIDPHRHRGVVKVHWRVPWVGGLFSWVVATFTLWSKCCHRGCLNDLIFLNLGLCAACWAHAVCYHELWLTSVRHPFSFLNRF